MPSLFNPAAYHILSYGTLLGTSIFNTFFQGIVAFKVLPRPSFSVLQQSLFPYYFSLQTLLPISALLTYPAPSFSALTDSPLLSSITAPLMGMSFMGALNWAWIGPQTTKVMRQRKHQETRDGKKYSDQGPHSEEMQRLNSTFSILHGASSLVNVVEIGLVIWYGFVLADKLTL